MPLDGQRIMRAVGTLLAESEEAQAKALEDLRSEMAGAIAALPPPEPGEPGRDGTDRVVAAPCAVGPNQPCEHNTIIHHRSGLWQAIRATTGDPDNDPAGWKCIVPGIADIEVGEDFAARRIFVTLRTSDGRAKEVSWRSPATYLPPDWRQRGWGIIAGDILREGDHDYIALVDAPGNPQGGGTDNWQKVQVIGRRGKPGNPGKPGDPGPPGPGLAGLSIVRDPAGGSLSILPEYADHRVRAEPIAIDLLTEVPAEGRAVIVGFAGPFHTSKKYGRGDVVSALVQGQPTLWLSRKADNRDPLADGPGWQRMI